MIAVNYLKDIDRTNGSIEYRYLKTISRYRGLNDDNIKLIEENNLIVIMNSGLDGNNKVAVYDANYSDDFKDDITKEVELNQKYFVIRFIR